MPDNWDGVPFTAALRAGKEEGRELLVVSQAAWSCMRSVRFRHAGEDYICLRTYHDGYKDLEPVMLFNLTHDPHEQHDLAPAQPELVNLAMGKLAGWQQDQMLTHTGDVDPMMTVLREGGPFHTRGTLPRYLAHLRATGARQPPSAWNGCTRKKRAQENKIQTLSGPLWQQGVRMKTGRRSFRD